MREKSLTRNPWNCRRTCLTRNEHGDKRKRCLTKECLEFFTKNDSIVLEKPCHVLSLQDTDEKYWQVLTGIVVTGRMAAPTIGIKICLQKQQLMIHSCTMWRTQWRCFGLTVQVLYCELGRKRLSGSPWNCSTWPLTPTLPHSKGLWNFLQWLPLALLRAASSLRRPLKGAMWAFPCLSTSLVSFSKEEIKETRQEVAFILWSHYTPLGALVPRGKPLSWSDKKSCFLEDLSGHWNLQPSCQQDAGCLISSLSHNLCETPVAKTVKRWREGKMMDESIARLEEDEWVCGRCSGQYLYSITKDFHTRLDTLPAL